jgi:hypothetical protein
MLFPARLEGWRRAFYSSAEIDIGSSGVENFSLEEEALVEAASGVRMIQARDYVTLHLSSVMGARLGFRGPALHLLEGLRRLSVCLEEAAVGSVFSRSCA